MKSTWLAFCTACIASFFVATPALADWKNFGLGAPGASLPVQGGVNVSSEQHEDGLGGDDGLNQLIENFPLDIPSDVPGPSDTGGVPQGPSSSLLIQDLAPQAAEAPEPGTIALIAQCLLCLAWAARRKS